MMEYMKYKPTYYANLFWISRHREAKKPFLYPRIDGTTVDNIHIYNDLKLSQNIKKTILLSPAAASFDQFSNFENRGVYFKNLITKKFRRRLHA